MSKSVDFLFSVKANSQTQIADHRTEDWWWVSALQGHALAPSLVGLAGPQPWLPRAEARVAQDVLSFPPQGPAQASPQYSQVDFVVQTCDALVCPVFPQLGQNVAQSV